MYKPMDLGGRIVPVKANTVALKEVLDLGAYRGERIGYTYDFGDHLWGHTIELIGLKTNVTNFVACIDGE